MNEFNSQICTSIEQSKRLLELGLKPETADCMHSFLVRDFRGKDVEESDRHYYLTLFNQDEFQSVGLSKYEKTPAWSLHRLILLCGVTTMFTRDVLSTAYDDQINAIENLIKNGYFNKEYLKQ